MSAASVLWSFSPSAMPGPVMPMDVAMRFYLSHSPPPLRGFLSSYEELHRTKNRVNRPGTRRPAPPLRPCLSGRHKASSKKRVVFADTQGMALTAIHVFNKFDEGPYRGGRGGSPGEELQFDMTDLEKATAELRVAGARGLALDFVQPSADYLDFRKRLLENSVCLENCSLQQRALSGTIKVRNVGFEKSVQVRATFDSWRSFTEVPCSFMNNVYGCQDSDTFAFALELPAHVPPQNRVEFCVCFQVQGQTFWDNNRDRNYVLKHVGVNGEDLHEPTNGQRKGAEPKLLEMELDQFGSPRTSSGLFPGWQSWGQIQDAVPYW